MSYSFLKFDVSESLSEYISDYVSFINSNLLYIEDDRYGIESISHCTILSGIYDTKVTTIRRLLSKNNIKSFDIELGEISFFKQPKYNVLKIDIISPELYQLNELMIDNIEYCNDNFVYSPHITLAYLTTICEIKDKNKFKGIKEHINNLIYHDRNIDDYEKINI